MKTVVRPSDLPVETGTPQLLASLRADGVATVVLNNPERRNALSRAMMVRLPEALDALLALGARVIVLTGASDRAFAAGADLTEVGRDATPAGSAEIEVVYRAMLQAVRELPVPTISMVRGACLGGGLELALMTDLRYAADNSFFGIPAVRLGLAYARVEPLVALIGPSRTAELLYTGDRMHAAEALAAGLINAMVQPVDELEDWVLDRAIAIAGNAPLAIRAVKLALREAAKPSEERDEVGLQQAEQQCRDSSDFAEGRLAFLEKRAPVFIGA